MKIFARTGVVPAWILFFRELALQESRRTGAIVLTPRDDPGGSVERRREPPTWFKVSFGAAALLGAMLLVMWAQHGLATCAISFEAPRRLQLDRPVDRDHLAADGASAGRTARRYTAATAGADQQQRFLECENLLVSAIAATHGVSGDQVRAATGYAR
jgi:hypothetical protein